VERPDAPVESISGGWNPKQRLVEARLFEDGVHDVAPVGRPRDAADLGIPVRAAVRFTTGNGSNIDIADTRPLVSDECQRPSVWPIQRSGPGRGNSRPQIEATNTSSAELVERIVDCRVGHRSVIVSGFAFQACSFTTRFAHSRIWAPCRAFSGPSCAAGSTREELAKVRAPLEVDVEPVRWEGPRQGCRGHATTTSRRTGAFASPWRGSRQTVDLVRSTRTSSTPIRPQLEVEDGAYDNRCRQHFLQLWRPIRTAPPRDKEVPILAKALRCRCMRRNR
jgi:hypothetical protein